MMDQRTAYKHVKDAFTEVQKLSKLPKFESDELKSVLSMKYGHGHLVNAIDILSKIPKTIPVAKRKAIFMEFGDASFADIYDKMADKVSILSEEKHLVFAPPVGICLNGCTNEKTGTKSALGLHNDAVRVKYYSLNGVEGRKKITTRCINCYTNYNLTKYGKKEPGFQLYNEQRNVIEISDGVIADRKFFEHYCSVHLHGHVTFEGFAESFKSTHRLSDEDAISRRQISDMYYIGEVEEEIRRLGKLDHPYNDNQLSSVMEWIDQYRQADIYTHVCTPYCESKGCQKLHVLDGIWKIVFSVCAMRTENEVKGLPLVKYPDVCVNPPEFSEAFCSEHVKVMKEHKLPTKLRDFLKHCGVAADEGKRQPTSEEIEKLPERNELKKTGTSIISTQVGRKLITDQTDGVRSILDDCDQEPTPAGEDPCNKETGHRKGLNMKSRGYLFIVTAGGFIEMFNPLYRSESPSQVFLIVLSFLYTFLEKIPESDFSSIWLAYDNMCNLVRLKAAQMPELPLDGKFKYMWAKVNKMIDGFHISNHTRHMCKTVLNPSRFEEAYPSLKESNSMAAEQIFSWLGKFKKQLCSIPKEKQIFMLHRLSIRRNKYTSACHAKRRDPLAPRVKRKRSHKRKR